MSLSHTKLFLTKRIPGAPIPLLITSYFKEEIQHESTLFLDTLPPDFAYEHLEFVDTPEDADFFFFPHGVSKKGRALLTEVENAKREAAAHGKVLIVMVGGDLIHDFFIDGVLVLKGSQYGYLKRPNEVIMPYFVEDLSFVRSITIRKKNEKAVIGFCGWAGFKTVTHYVKYLARNISLDLVSLIPGLHHLTVHKRGVYWRRRSLSLLSRDSRFEKRFIVRSSFSGSKKTIAMNPSTARREYLDNLYDCDLALSPKGDANTALRFFEALSLGRVPIVIDTDMTFILPETLNYETFTLRIPCKKIDHLGDIVATFWENLTDEKYAAMQKAARDAFINYLRYDKFFSYVFHSPEFKKALASLNEIPGQYKTKETIQ